MGSFLGLGSFFSMFEALICNGFGLQEEPFSICHSFFFNSQKSIIVFFFHINKIKTQKTPISINLEVVVHYYASKKASGFFFFSIEIV